MVEGGVVGAPVYEVQVVEVLEGEHDLRRIEPGVRLAGGGVRGCWTNLRFSWGKGDMW